MKLLHVYSAKHHPSGNIDMQIRAEINGEEVDIPFGYSPLDQYGLAPEIKEWWKGNTGFPISDADAAIVDATPTGLTLKEALIQKGILTASDFVKATKNG